MLTLTHKEIGKTIEASGETVTGLFANFKREGLIEVRGATVIIPDKQELDFPADPAAKVGGEDQSGMICVQFYYTDFRLVIGAPNYCFGRKRPLPTP